jgi:SAM-dependent methyltransferase
VRSGFGWNLYASDYRWRVTPDRYVERDAFILDRARGRKVLDCGVIGATELPREQRLALIPKQLHWRIAAEADAVGTDLDAELVDAVQARYPQLRLVAADMEQIRLEETFDLVIMGDLIEHLNNPGAALERASDLLAPGGELLISCPNALGLPNYLRFLAGRFREGGDHVHSFNCWTLENLLKRHGFRVTSMQTALDRKPVSRWKRALVAVVRPLLRAFPKLGGTLVVTAVHTQSAPA